MLPPPGWSRLQEKAWDQSPWDGNASTREQCFIEEIQVSIPLNKAASEDRFGAEGSFAAGHCPLRLWCESLGPSVPPRPSPKGLRGLHPIFRFSDVTVVDQAPGRNASAIASIECERYAIGWSVGKIQFWLEAVSALHPAVFGHEVVVHIESKIVDAQTCVEMDALMKEIHSLLTISPLLVSRPA